MFSKLLPNKKKMTPYEKALDLKAKFYKIDAQISQLYRHGRNFVYNQGFSIKV